MRQNGLIMTALRAPLPLESILNDINRAIDAKLYYPALLVALTIPEICVTLCWDKQMFVREKHYVDFVNKYTKQDELGLDGLTCYRLRGGVVHRGNAAGHPHFGRSHVIFTTPESGSALQGFSVESGEGTAAHFDLRAFCDAMIKGATLWFNDHKAHPKVVENMPRLLSWRPFGVPPFVAGMPVIASEA